MDNFPAELFESAPGRIAAGYKFFTYLQPFLMNGVRGTGHLFIGTHPVDALHENVAQSSRIHAAQGKCRGNLEAGVPLQAAQIDGNNGDMCISRLFQCPPDEADIVGCTAPASGLADDDCQVVRIVFPG